MFKNLKYQSSHNLDSRFKMQSETFYVISMKEFLEKFFELCREYQEEVPPYKMAEILRDYADRLDG